jgi:hypothetical protein
MWTRLLLLSLVLCAGFSLASGATVFSASGVDAASITTSLNDFRASLGALNPNQPVEFNGGRREINWDAVPAGASSPNPFPGNFFNGNVPGRARGIVFSTPGTGFLVSTPGAGEPFSAFSPQKIFEPTGSFETDAVFFSPADQTTPALSSGFGVIFLDVDTNNSAAIEFFGLSGASLGKWFAPPASGDNTFSFLGVSLGVPEIARVRITSGTFQDPVKMDDFLYGEPSPVPEPGTAALLSVGAIFFLAHLSRRANR